MSRILVYVLFFLALTGCKSKPYHTEATTRSDSEIEMILGNKEASDDSTSNVPSLNDVRFSHFTEQDWYDNDYFRILRSYIDGVNKGAIEEDEEIKPLLEGEFVVVDATEYMMGGMLIRFIFLKHPDKLFESWVYSDVDLEKQTVTDYYVRTISLEDEDLQGTKEDLLQFIKENPGMKLW